MNPAIELEKLRSKAEYVNNQLNETYEDYVDEVEEEFLEEYNLIYRNILAKIRKVRRRLNVLALNGFTWTQGHTDLITERLDIISSRIEDLADFAMFS